MIQELFARIGRRRAAHTHARVGDIQQLILLIAQHELGIAKGAFDENHCAEILEAEQISEADLRANIDLAKRRVGWAQLAANEESLKAESERLTTEAEAFDVAETKRHRDALKQLGAMQEAASRVSSAHTKAFIARAELESSAAPPADAAELQEQLTEVNAQISRVEQALNPAGDLAETGGLWSSVERNPARLVVQTRAALAEKNAGYSPEHRTQLESQLKAAERAVEQRQEELARLLKQRAAINAKQTGKPADALRPEHFAIVHATPGRDELKKQHAIKYGFHA